MDYKKAGTILEFAVIVLVILAVAGPPSTAAQNKPDANELRAIAEEAYLYGFPMIVGYSVM